jgi:hypothetical protein
VESGEEAGAASQSGVASGIAAFEQQAAACCYAKSDEYWITDPQGVAWETFQTLDTIPVYGNDVKPSAQACCEPAKEAIGTSSSVQEQARCCRSPAGERSNGPTKLHSWMRFHRAVAFSPAIVIR